MRTLLAFILSLLALGATAADVGQEALLKRIDAKDRSLVVLDVRTPAEFAEGHVPGARNIPHDAIEGQMSSLEGLKDKDVVVYCRSGKRAGLALETLSKHGFTRLSHLEGDMQGWLAAGRPVEKPADPPKQ
jgi:rhodanese-related sulfurtransferase